MSEETLAITNEQIDRLIEWLRDVQRPQTLDDMARQYIKILQSEAESD